jgi:protein-tyrosine phosphatase
MSEGEGILFVCLGNICRSPLAEAVARREFERAGLELPVDSCGIGSWHIGEVADPRSVRVGASAGYDLKPHRARQLEPADFTRWRWLLAMDMANLRDLRALCPPHLHGRLGLFLDFTGVENGGEVPDPYMGGVDDFRTVVALAQEGVQGLIERLRAR